MKCLLDHFEIFVEAQQMSMGQRLEMGKRRPMYFCKDLKIQLSINSLMYQPPPNFHVWWRKQGPESAVIFHILEESPLPLTLSAQKPV